jgi:hypothetical protein
VKKDNNEITKEVDFYENCAKNEVKNNNFKGAIEHYNKIIDFIGENEYLKTMFEGRVLERYTRTNIAMCEFLDSNFTAGIEQCEKIMEIEPASAEIW